VPVHHSKTATKESARGARPNPPRCSRRRAVVEERAVAEEGLRFGQRHAAGLARVGAEAVPEGDPFEGHPLAAGAVRVDEAEQLAVAAAVEGHRGARGGADGEALAGVVDEKALGGGGVGAGGELDDAAVLDTGDGGFEGPGVLGDAHHLSEGHGHEAGDQQQKREDGSSAHGDSPSIPRGRLPRRDRHNGKSTSFQW
jgi:hypothetical protein